MRGLVRKTFVPNLRVMQFFGLYPSRNYKILYKTYAYIYYFILIVPPPILTSLYFVFGENIDLAFVAQNVFAIAETGCFVFKAFQFIKNVEKVRKCLYRMENSIFLTYTQAQAHIVDKYISVCTRNSYFFLFLCSLTAVTWSIAPLFGKDYKLPLDIWLPYNTDITSGGKSYVLSYIFVVLGVSSDAIANGAIDPLIGGLVYYATTQIRILKNNLENVNQDAEEELLNINQENNKNDRNEVLKAMLIYKRLKFCIDHHNAILDFVDVYEETFSSMLFVQLSVSVVVICISCLQLSMVEPFTASFFSMIIMINSGLMQILFYCYYGSTLFEESNSLTNAAYMSEWYEYDIKSKRTLIILMERCQRPIIVTSGKILDVSLVTFTKILNRSYSLFAVLKNY